MKKLVLVLAACSVAFAGREDISILNQQILALQSDNQELKNENKALTDAVKILETKSAQLDSLAKMRFLTVEEQKAKIEDLEKKLKNAVASLEMINRPTTTVTTPVAPVAATPVVSLFPITSTIMTKKAHDASNIAVLLAFYNASAESVSSFEARLRFSQNGEELLSCNVNVNKPVPSTENATWYGAVPYNSTDPKNVRFFDADPSAITVSVEVLSVVLTNGTVRKFK